jgi:hypothetical protein
MFRWGVRVSSDARRRARAAEKALGGFRDDMLDIVEDAAEELRETDPYQNRTGNLRENTKAAMQGDVISLVMDEDYASYVNAKGLTGIDEAAEDAAKAIETAQKNLIRKIQR